MLFKVVTLKMLEKAKDKKINRKRSFIKVRGGFEAHNRAHYIKVGVEATHDRFSCCFLPVVSKPC